MLIYLAIPYTGMEEKSFKVANKVAAGLMKQGYAVYSPISQNHPIAKQENLPTGWGFWRNLDKQVIMKCDMMWVVQLGGWKESVGVQAEMKMADDLNIPIHFISVEP